MSSRPIVFKKTWAALACLEELIRCDYCYSRTSALSFIGICDHTFCSKCLEKDASTQCPVCKVPVTVKDIRPVRQLIEISELCCSFRRRLDEYGFRTSVAAGGTLGGGGLSGKDNIPQRKSFNGNASTPKHLLQQKCPRSIAAPTKRSRLSQNEDTSVCAKPNGCNGDTTSEASPVFGSNGERSGAAGTLTEFVHSPECRPSGNCDGPPPASAAMKTNRKGETALHLACQRGDVVSVRELLSGENPADPNVVDNAGWAPLHEASIVGHNGIVTLLLDHGAVVDPVGYDFATPLHVAIQRGRVEVVEVLVNFGADINAKTASGDTPITLAEKCVTFGPEFRVRMSRALQTPRNIQKRPFVNRPRGQIGLSYSYLENEEIREIIKIADHPNFASYFHLVPHFNAIDTTHLVVGKSPAERSFKYLASILKGKWVVTFDWIKASIRAGHFVDEEEFEVSGSIIHPESGGPRLSRTNSRMMKPGLFAGCRVCFWGKFPKPGLTVDQLKQLIEFGQGTVEKRPPVIDTADSLESAVVGAPYHADHQRWSSGSLVVYCNEDDHERWPRRVKNLPRVPLSWLIDCIDYFRLFSIEPLTPATPVALS